jgi:hypothetical protein
VQNSVQDRWPWRNYKKRAIIAPDDSSFDYLLARFTTFAGRIIPECHSKFLIKHGCSKPKDNVWVERFWRTIKYEYIYILPEENRAALCICLAA